MADKKLLEKIADGLSIMDKTAMIPRDKKCNVLYDKEMKDTELVKYEEDIDTYMAREVLPHVSDAKVFFEENLGAKKPVIKADAERFRSPGISINTSSPSLARSWRRSSWNRSFPC